MVEIRKSVKYYKIQGFVAKMMTAFWLIMLTIVICGAVPTFMISLTTTNSGMADYPDNTTTGWKRILES